MRYLLMGLMMSLLACSLAWAQDVATEDEAAMPSKSEVTGLPVYQGPEYQSVDSHQDDVTVAPDFHSFQHQPVEVVGYSPLTLEDFRYPVVRRTYRDFAWEQVGYPDFFKTVWHDDCHGFTVSAYFFTRDMIRDHIQMLIDSYYVCEPALVQQLIDYYAEVTPQCGEAISWVWFSVDEKGHNYADLRPNRYFERYLYNFKDKFYLEFGMPNAQSMVDKSVTKFLYQYRKRGKFNCGPELVERPCGTSCDKCEAKAEKCNSCVDKTKCSSCTDTNPCGKCREQCNKPHDEGLYCEDFKIHGFNLDPNEHYLYYPRKVVIEDITYDNVARAYRWKFAWRFNECEVDFLKQMCSYGQPVQFALVLSDPTWFARSPLNGKLERNILASLDPQTWGNVWPAGNLPFDKTCCECFLPTCDGNCMEQPSVGWAMPEPAPEPMIEPEMVPEPEEPAQDFNYFPPEQPEKEKEVIKVKGNG